jgi:hypothetical protein
VVRPTHLTFNVYVDNGPDTRRTVRKVALVNFDAVISVVEIAGA